MSGTTCCSGACPPASSPRDAKRALARALVTRFHGEAAAAEAEAAFDRVFVSRELPEEIEEAPWWPATATCTCPS